MKIFWKCCRRRLKNPISIVLSNSIIAVWKCFPWCGYIVEIKRSHCGTGPVFPVKYFNYKNQLDKGQLSRQFGLTLLLFHLLYFYSLHPVGYRHHRTKLLPFSHILSNASRSYRHQSYFSIRSPQWVVWCGMLLKRGMENEVFDVNWRWNASFKLHVDGIMQV